MAQIVTADTDNLSAQITFEIDDEIADLQADIAPITTLTQNLMQTSTVSAETHRYEWFEDDIRHANITANESIDASETVIDVNSGDADKVHPDMLLMNTATDEVMFVEEKDASANTITVTRGYGNSSAQSSSTSSDTLLILGPAMMQGSGSPEIVTRTPSKEHNFVQIFKHPFETTETLNESVLDAPESQFNREQSKKQREHLAERERAFIFGTRNEDTSAKHPRYTTRGVLRRITTNVETSIGTLTEDKLNNFAQSAFDFGSGEKWLMAGSNILSAIDGFARDDLQTRVDDSTFGIHVNEYRTTFGMLNIVEHKIFSRHGLAGLGFILDTMSMESKFMSNRNTQLELNIQAPDEDVTRAQFLAEGGMKIENEEKHMKLRGVS